MAKITNMTRETLSFVVGAENGVALTDSIAPGETKDLAVDANDAQLKGRILSGVIAVDGDMPAAPKGAARTSAAERRTASTLSGDASVRD